MKYFFILILFLPGCEVLETGTSRHDCSDLIAQAWDEGIKAGMRIEHEKNLKIKP